MAAPSLGLTRAGLTEAITMGHRRYVLSATDVPGDVLADVLRWVAARYGCLVQLEAKDGGDVGPELRKVYDSAQRSFARIAWDQLGPAAWRAVAAQVQGRKSVSVVLVQADRARLSVEGRRVELRIEDADEPAFRAAFADLPVRLERPRWSEVLPAPERNPARTYGRWILLRLEASGRAPVRLTLAAVACGIGASLVASLVTPSERAATTSAYVGIAMFVLASAGCAVLARWGRK